MLVRQRPKALMTVCKKRLYMSVFVSSVSLSTVRHSSYLPQVKVQLSYPSKVCIILFFCPFRPGDRGWFMCWTQVHCHLRFVFTKVLPGNDSSTNTKKYKKMHFPFGVRFFSEVHLWKLLMVCSCQTCLNAYIQPCVNGRWKLWAIVPRETFECSQWGK